MKKTLVLLSFSSLALAGCSDLYAPPSTSNERLQVRQESSEEQIPVAEANDEYLVALAQALKQNGAGPVDLTVTYDPQSSSNTAMKAGDQAARIARVLRGNGVNDVRTSLLPVREHGGESLAMFNFTSYKAAPPENCGTIPGYETRDIDPNEYKLGCTVETLFAKQVANPADLLGGNNPTPTTDGRRAANIVDVYRSGAPNEPLKGEQASGSSN